MIDFDTFTKNLGKLIVAKGFKKLPKCNKSPNLVTLQMCHIQISSLSKCVAWTLK